jgi:hypothetical protein
MLPWSAEQIIFSIVFIVMALAAKHLMSPEDSVLRVKIPVPGVVAKFFTAGFSIFVPVAIGFGYNFTTTDFELALWWFGAAAMSAVIALFLWDETQKLNPTEKELVRALAIAIILLIVWKTDGWVAERTVQFASVITSKAANDYHFKTGQRNTPGT